MENAKPDLVPTCDWRHAALLFCAMFLFVLGVRQEVSSASFKLLRPVDTTCNRPAAEHTISFEPMLRLAADGGSSSSDVHIACANIRRELIYVRYAPGQGVVERTRLPGSHVRFSRVYANPPYAIAYAKPRTYLAWIGRNKRIILARRRGQGPWQMKNLRPGPHENSTPFQLALAARGQTAYLAWTLSATNCPDEDEYEGDPHGQPQPVPCYPDHVVTSVVKWRDGASRYHLRPSPAPCGNSKDKPAFTSDPSIAVSDAGPLIGVLDTCEAGQASGNKLWRITRKGPRGFPSPAFLGEPTPYFIGKVSATAAGSVYLLAFRHNESWGTEAAYTKLVGGTWTEAAAIGNLAGIFPNEYSLARSRGRLFAGYVAALPPRGFGYVIAERTAQGWQAKEIPSARNLGLQTGSTDRAVGDLTAAGRFLYYDAGFPALGRAQVAD